MMAMNPKSSTKIACAPRRRNAKKANTPRRDTKSGFLGAMADALEDILRYERKLTPGSR